MGGHAEAMLGATGEGTRLLGLDRDPEALRRAGERLAPFADRVQLTQASFRDVADVAREHGLTAARAILLDEPPSLDAREITDKGSLNQKAVLKHRHALVDELYAKNPSPRVIAATQKLAN